MFMLLIYFSSTAGTLSLLLINGHKLLELTSALDSAYHDAGLEIFADYRENHKDRHH